jgi:hypothetical protein
MCSQARHCERSEAIQVAVVACGLLRRFTPRNDAPAMSRHPRDSV